MRFANPSLAILSTRSEKEAKLKEFITEALAGVAAGEAVTIVARSLESPVAQALHAVLGTCDPSRVALRVILIDPSLDENAPASLLDTLNGEFRVLRDARFCDAHEQLVMSQQACWIGDCMRRDPTKRDAFEIYMTGDAAKRTHVALSFAKLWATAEPLRRVTPERMATAVIAAEQTTLDTTSGRDTRR